MFMVDILLRKRLTMLMCMLLICKNRLGRFIIRGKEVEGSQRGDRILMLLWKMAVCGCLEDIMAKII